MKNRKYPYLRFKIVIPSILLILIVVFGCCYFFGGLKASSLSYDNMEWSSEGFKDMYEYSSEEKSAELNENYLVSHNSKYVMLFNEKTTIVSIYSKGAGWSEESPTTNATLLYTTARTDTSLSNYRSNISLNYYDYYNNNSILNSWDKSVNYVNLTTGDTERHYQVRYNSDSSSVDVLYSIGDFAPYVFPASYDYEDFMNTFVGNCVFQLSTTVKTDVEVYDEDGNRVTDLTTEGYMFEDRTATSETGLALRYNSLIILTNEAAKYILESGLSSIRHSSNRSLTFTEYSEEAAAQIDEVVNGYWLATDLYDENDRLKFVNGVNYNCNPDDSGNVASPLKINQFMHFSLFDTLLRSIYQTQYNSDNGIVTLDWNNYIYNMSIASENDIYMSFRGATNVNFKQQAFNYLYVSNYDVNPDGSITYRPHPMYDNVLTTSTCKPYYYDYNGDGIYTVDEYVQYGGFPAIDENGNFLYSEDGLRAIQSAFTVEMAEQQNELFGNFENTSVIVFDIGIRFELTINGLEVTMAYNSIAEDNDATDEEIAVLGQVQICPYLTATRYATGREKEGQMIIPDGSGAIISFNSEKAAQFATKYQEKRVYGNDSAINITQQTYNTQNILLGMYGFLEIEDGKGLVCIADKGAAQMGINADIQRASDNYNYIYFNTYLRESENVQITTNTSYLKTTNERYQGDIKICYYILEGEDLSYVDVAAKYREYLLNKYNLYEKQDTTAAATPTIKFIGAYEKKAFRAGIVTDVEYSLTTFDQAKEIVEELTNEGITSMNVGYYSWTKEEMYEPTSTKTNVASVLGGKRAFNNLASYLKNAGINFFPNYRVASGNGYDLLFGTLKYNTKSISGSYSSALAFVISTGLENPDIPRGQYLSPIYYNSLVLKYMANFTKLESNGIFLSDLGYQLVSDYSRKVQLYATGGTMYQQQALATAKENVDYVMLYSPNDYAFQYVDVAEEVPVQTTMYEIVDRSIPLYQLVVSGLFDYTSKSVNYDNDYSISWNILKALETGSNLAFELAAEDTNVLLDTMYTDFYNTYYSNWKQNILYMHNELNSTGIYGGRLINHEYLTDNVVKVNYSNGVEIIINYDNDNYVDANTGIVVLNNWYAVMPKEGSGN